MINVCIWSHLHSSSISCFICSDILLPEASLVAGELEHLVMKSRMSIGSEGGPMSASLAMYVVLKIYK